MGKFAVYSLYKEKIKIQEDDYMFQIISDSGCDFTKEEAKAKGVEIIPFYITFDQVNYLKEGIDIDTAEYFQRLRSEKNLFPKTSQPNPQDYIDLYTPHLEAGKDILVLTISSKLSGSNQSAKMAAEMLAESFPDRSIQVVDSYSASIGQGLILDEIVSMRDSGYSLERTVAIGEKIVKSTRLYVTLDSLEYLKRGGRVGPTTALVGGILGLKPILQVENGEVSQLDSVRGRKKALALIEEGMVATLKGEMDSVHMKIGHILSKEEAEQFKKNTEKALNVTLEDAVVEVGAAIGTHAGPGGIVFAYCKKHAVVALESAA